MCGATKHQEMLAAQPRLFNLAHDLTQVVHLQQIFLIEFQNCDSNIIKYLPTFLEKLVEIEMGELYWYKVEEY